MKKILRQKEGTMFKVRPKFEDTQPTNLASTQYVEVGNNGEFFALLYQPTGIIALCLKLSWAR